MQEEIFGSILPILTYRDLGEVIAVVKGRPKALAGYIFSRDRGTIDRLLEALPFGGGAVNQTVLHCMIDDLPFGGVGASGLGRYYGKAGFESLSQGKSVLYAEPGVAIEELILPYADGDYEKFAGIFAS